MKGLRRNDDAINTSTSLSTEAGIKKTGFIFRRRRNQSSQGKLGQVHF